MALHRIQQKRSDDKKRIRIELGLLTQENFNAAVNASVPFMEDMLTHYLTEARDRNQLYLTRIALGRITTDQLKEKAANTVARVTDEFSLFARQKVADRKDAQRAVNNQTP